MRIRLIILLFFVLSTLTGLSQGKVSKSEAKKMAQDSLQNRKELENTALFIEAKKQEILGNYDVAVQIFNQLLIEEPENDAVYFELANISTLQNRIPDALVYAEKANTLNSDNKWYQIQLANLYQKSGEYDECTKIYEALMKSEPNDLEYRFQLAVCYILIGKYADAIDEYDFIEEKIGVVEDISIQKQKIYLQINDFDKAVIEAQKLITSDPEENRYYAILAELYMSNNMPERAFEIYKTISEKFPDDPYIHISLSDYYRKKGDQDKAFDELKLGFANPVLDIDTKIQILLSYYSRSKNDDHLKNQAMTLTTIMIEAHPGDPKAYSMYADFLVQDNKYREAREAFYHVIALDSSKYLVWEGLLRVEAELADYKALEKESQCVIDLFPYQPLGYFFNGAANYQLKNYEEAIHTLEKGTSYIVDNTPLLGQFYAQIGDSYYQIKDYKSSDAAYEKSLSLDPNNSYVLNNYAYYLSLRGESLQKAEQMAEKATRLDPGNSSNEDTYGWVLYKSDRLNEAEEWIFKAIKSSKEPNPIILEHYGDILYHLGKKEEAMQYWEKAKQAGKGSDILEKKLRDGMLYE
jgi:tetratricopeptide (TPR) repeat protein